MNDPQSGTENFQPPIIPPRTVVFFLVSLWILGTFVGQSLILLICNINGMDYQQTILSFGKDSPGEMRQFMRGVLLLNHLMSFLLPPILAGILLKRSAWQEAVGVHLRPKIGTLALGVGLVLSAFPLAQAIFQVNGWLVDQLSFLKPMTETEAATQGLMEGLLIMPSPLEFLFSLLVIAILPAIAEEMLFRGILQQQFERWLKRPLPAIFLTALIFGLAHFQVQRFLAIFGLGLLLGLIFYWTKNLWVSIAAHFCFNGVQVVAAWFYQEKLDKLNSDEPLDIPMALIVLSIGAVVFLSTVLKKKGEMELVKEEG